MIIFFTNLCHYNLFSFILIFYYFFPVPSSPLLLVLFLKPKYSPLIFPTKVNVLRIEIKS